MAFPLMTWSSRTAYCSREKTYFFTVIWVSLFFFSFFSPPSNFILGNRHRRLNALHSCQNMRDDSGCGTDILITSCRYHRLDNASSPLLCVSPPSLFHFIFLGDYAKQNIVIIIFGTWTILLVSPPCRGNSAQKINTATPLTSDTHLSLCSLLLPRLPLRRNQIKRWHSNL